MCCCRIRTVGSTSSISQALLIGDWGDSRGLNKSDILVDANNRSFTLSKTIEGMLKTLEA